MSDASYLPTYIGLGSNLDDPVSQIQQALAWLGQLPETRLLATSPLYRSCPVGPQDQPDFVNAVALIETRLDPLALLDRLQAREREQGRVHRRHWGERSLDLDVLLYGEQTIRHPRLSVPHPQLTRRDFVLRPLLDIQPELHLPDQSRAQDHLVNCQDNQLQPLSIILSACPEVATLTQPQ